MIHLLQPEEAKTAPSRALQEQRRRADDLSEEETRLVRSINFLREEEVSERKHIDSSMRKLCEDSAIERDNIRREIELLRTQRRPLLIPIEEIRREAEMRNDESKARAAALDDREKSIEKREKEVKESKEVIAESLEDIFDRKDELDRRDERVSLRENRAEEAAKALKESTNNLNERWAVYHEAMVKQNKVFSEREWVINGAEKSNTVRSSELENVAREQTNKDREIADKYATLGRAIEHAKKDGVSI